MNDSLTLSDVLGRQVAVEWHEGVALARGVAERLLEQANEPQAVPELHQVHISPRGEIDVIGATISGDAVRRLGQLLQATLGHAEPPVQLRLVISQATAPAPAFGSIKEYDDALAYFERPGRPEVLRGLHARVAAAPAALDSLARPTLDGIAPLPAPERSTKAQKVNRQKTTPRGSKLVAACAIVAVMVGAAALYVRGQRNAQSARDLALHTSDAVGTAVVNGLSAVTEAVGLGRIVSADSTAVELPTPATAAPSLKTPTIRTPARTSGGGAVPAFDRNASASNRAPEGPLAVSVEAPPAPSTTSAEAVNSGALTGIYSSESPGVTPPVAIRAPLPRELPANAGHYERCRIELVVSAAGRVESARLLDAPRNVHDSMFLSAVKAWRFQPASKDGRPVAYRTVVVRP